MPEPVGNETPATRAQSERTEAKFFEEVDKLIAQADSLGAEYKPPNQFAAIAALKAKRAAALAQREVRRQAAVVEETARNERERLFKPLSQSATSVVEYVKSAGAPANGLNRLKSIARDLNGRRAKPVAAPTNQTNQTSQTSQTNQTNQPNQPNQPSQTAEAPPPDRISVSQMSFASRADNYADFIEQYAALDIDAAEDAFKAGTHRARLGALRAANSAVIDAESRADQANQAFDRLVYTEPDSLAAACASAKSYLKSKYKTAEPYKNVAALSFQIPSRLR